MSIIARLFCVALVAGSGRADDLPSPDAMWLGQRIVPRAAVDGFRDAVAKDVLDKVLGGRVAAVDQPTLRARARTAMSPLLDEAFPPELLAGFAAQFLAAHYSADELRALRAREESPLGEKLRAFERSAADLAPATPGTRDDARDALARRTFTESERKELEAFADGPLGRKGSALAPDLLGTFVDRLERRYAAVRPDIEPRLRNVVEAVLVTAGK
jgi:hypothetical protein